MTENSTGFLRLAGLPLLFAVLGLPMALRLVPPNPVYGYRTAATLASDGAWFLSNAWMGVAFVVAGALCLGLNAIILRGALPIAPELRPLAVTFCDVGVMLACVAVAVVSLPRV